MTGVCNCTELARIAKIVDDNNPQGFAKLAEHPAVIVVAYLFVILPWGFLYNFDYISEKWRTIHHTRRLGQIHLAIAICPMPVIIFYTVLQAMSEDYKEMMAGIIGTLMSIYHVFGKYDGECD